MKLGEFFGGFNSQVVAAVIILILSLSIFFGGFYLGSQNEKSKSQQTVIKQQVKQDKEIEKVQQAQVKREIVYKDRLKVIHDATDNCLPSDMPPDVLRQVCAGSTRSCPGS